jgi:peptidoglycan hydrolase CwlO-like protein
MPIQELRRTMGEMQAKLDILQAKQDVLQSKVNELQGKIGEDAEVLAEWQTARLVICGVFSLIFHKILT